MGHQHPGIVHLTVATPYPGTELWFTESRKLTTLDYRLFDIQHAVLPTKLPLLQFYQELVKTQDVLNRKHLGFAALKEVASIAGRLALHGQTNFLKMLEVRQRVQPRTPVRGALPGSEIRDAPALDAYRRPCCRRQAVHPYAKALTSASARAGRRRRQVSRRG